MLPWTTVALATGGSIALSLILLAIGLRNPRLMLQDYPADVRAAVPAKTAAERRETVWWSLPFLALLFGLPLVAAVAARLQQPDLSFGGAFLNALAVLLVFNLVDLLLLDWLVFCTLTPRFVVLAGTEGMAGYRDYGLHLRGFLIGMAMSLVASVLIGALTTVLPLA